jgi:hypothetical protein
VHAFVFGVPRHAVSGRDFVLGQAGVVACGADGFDELGALAGQLRQQEAPAITGDVDVLAADSIQDLRIGFADVEVRADLGTHLFRDAAEFDDDRAAVNTPPAPAPMTMASKSLSLMGFPPADQ